LISFSGQAGAKYKYGSDCFGTAKIAAEIVQRIKAMDEESLLVLHRLLLRLEKEQLWRELSAEAESDRRAGKFDRLTDIIREARAELRKG
jgi:hypothetical protein